MTNSQSVEKLKRQQKAISGMYQFSSSSPHFKKWKRDTEVAIEKIFGEETRHSKDFGQYEFFSLYNDTNETFHRHLASTEKLIQSMIDEIEEYGIESTAKGTTPSTTIEIIENICDRFPLVARQLRSRYNERATLEIEDEYDVQDLLHVLLKVHFDDVRPEEVTPSYAGTSSRTDFLLKKEKIFIEVKKTRKGLGQKEVVNELLIDIGRYQSHQDCKTLICFAYDPEMRITNPTAIESDVCQKVEGFEVRVIVSPKGL